MGFPLLDSPEIGVSVLLGNGLIHSLDAAILVGSGGFL